MLSWIGVACTVVEVRNSENGTVIERSFGLGSVQIDSPRGATVSRIRSLGYGVDPVGYGIGYRRNTIATSDGSCRLIVWVERGTDVEELSTALQKIESACVVVDE